MAVCFEGYILPDELPPVPMSAIDYWSDGDEHESDFSDDDYDEDEYDYDKDGRRRWKKKVKYKGDDPSKAIDWKKLFPNFDYDRFNRDQERAGEEECGDYRFEWPNDHCPNQVCKIFQVHMGRWPGDHKEWVYVRNIDDCEYYCQQLLESNVLPGVIGVDIEMENDRHPFREWASKWRTIRAHSRLAKGMFARLLQAANCDGLVVVFDLYALAKPHSWEGGIEMNAKQKHWKSPVISLPTSALPNCLVDFILSPGIIRFGWALHCDWSSLYNSFGLLVPQKSYLDAQTAWIHLLRSQVKGLGNGLADAALALFGVKLDKSKRGYGHFWHGMAPYGKIPKYMLAYAVKDAQISLDVALQVLIMTKWLGDLNGIWYSCNVETIPLPGVRKRVLCWFGKSDQEVQESGIGTDEEEGTIEDPQVTHELLPSNPEPESHVIEECCSSVEIMEDGDIRIVEEIKEGWPVVTEEPEDEEAMEDTQEDAIDVVSGTCRTVVAKEPIIPRPKTTWRHNRLRKEDLFWKQLPPPAQDFIKTCKGEAYFVFNQLPQGEKGKNIWSWCPALAMLRATMRFKLKRLIQNHVPAETGERYKASQSLYLYQKARILLDNNLASAWRDAFHESDCEIGAKKKTPWKSLKTFQDSVLGESPSQTHGKNTVFRSRHQRGTVDRKHGRGGDKPDLLRLALSSLVS